MVLKAQKVQEGERLLERAAANNRSPGKAHQGIRRAFFGKKSSGKNNSGIGPEIKSLFFRVTKSPQAPINTHPSPNPPKILAKSCTQTASKTQYLFLAIYSTYFQQNSWLFSSKIQGMNFHGIHPFSSKKTTDNYLNIQNIIDL